MFEKTTAEEIADLKRQIEALTSKINSRAQEGAKEAVHKSWDQLRETGDDLREKGKDVYKNADWYVRHNPWQSVAWTAAGALFLGWVISCVSHAHEDR
ncbi:MAG TPA: hypothetical protein VEA59_02065 [Patescibacteria group bacterium]|nr:hypothetical protein [Patescibacteria group bacterium]